jgi:hypothetical protein
MRKRLRALLVLASVTLVAGFAPTAANRLAHLDVFRVRKVELEGATHLTQAEAEQVAAIPSNASVWDDAADWEARVAAHPLVREVRVKRRLPSTLVFVVSEREAVALLPTPTLVPVDVEGRVLPLDPSGLALDLPLLSTSAKTAPQPGQVGSKDVVRLAREAVHLASVDPEFAGRISEIGLGERGDLIARLTDRGVTFRFHAGVLARRLEEGRMALAHQRVEEGAAVEVDLRFADQIVVRQIR